MSIVDKEIFKKNVDDYDIDIAPIENYVKQASTYVMIRTGITKEEAVKYIIKMLKESNVNNPLVTFKKRQENGDRKVEKVKLTTYIKDSLENKEIIVPSLTTYDNTDTKMSLHSTFILANVEKRKKVKKLALKYKQAMINE